MSACHDLSVSVSLREEGLASWSNIAEPHFLITQSGASRSVSP